jgi:hypothetical protein
MRRVLHTRRIFVFFTDHLARGCSCLFASGAEALMNF